MKKIIPILIIVLLLPHLAYARDYGTGVYGEGTYDSPDADGDGYYDDEDWLLYNESYVENSGLTQLNITIGSGSTSGKHNGTKEVLFYDLDVPIINFSHNFSSGNVLNLSRIKIEKAPTYTIINISGQLSTNKTLYFAQNGFTGLCTKDAEISTINEISPGCDGNNETDFTTCLGNSAGITLNGITCTDEGTRIVFKNLQHSGIRGSGSSPSGSSGTGGSGGGGRGSKGPPSAKVSVENIPQCSSNSDCELDQYCFDNSCHDAECISDDNCAADETCRNLRCVRLFDVIIKEFQPPIRGGDYLEVTYSVIGIADFNGNVKVDYWIENEEEKITSGKDTIFIPIFEEKVETIKLFLPSDLKTGNYIFKIKANFGTYSVESYKTVELPKEDNGTIAIEQIPETDNFKTYMRTVGFYFNSYWFYILGVLIIGLVILIKKLLKKKNKGARNKGKYEKKIRKSLKKKKKMKKGSGKKKPIGP